MPLSKLLNGCRKATLALVPWAIAGTFPIQIEYVQL